MKQIIICLLIIKALFLSCYVESNYEYDPNNPNTYYSDRQIAIDRMENDIYASGGVDVYFSRLNYLDIGNYNYPESFSVYTDSATFLNFVYSAFDTTDPRIMDTYNSINFSEYNVVAVNRRMESCGELSIYAIIDAYSQLDAYVLETDYIYNCNGCNEIENKFFVALIPNHYMNVVFFTYAYDLNCYD